MSRPFSRALASVAVLLALTTGAWAKVDIVVDLTTQRLTATRGDGKSATWPVSTGRFGLETPRGVAMRISRMDIDHHSKEFFESPMPYAMFFKSGFAVHGTYSGNLGKPASHGCVRLSLEHVAILWDWVEQEGGQVSVQGETPVPASVAERRTGRSTRGYAAREYPERDGLDRDRDVYYARPAASSYPDPGYPAPGHASRRDPGDGRYRERTTRTYTYRTEVEEPVEAR